jgi:serine/threonine protein kinase
MMDEADHNLSAGTVDGPSEALLERALAQQRGEWIAGKRTPAVEWLRQFPALAADPAQAAELVYHEFALREELGESPDWQAYLRQFPEYTPALGLLRQADRIVDQAFSSKEGAPPAEAAFADYQLLEELGRGGMGVVYKARHKRLERLVALKMIRIGPDAGAEERRRLVGEARAVARLHHPNIVQIYEVGEVEGQPFLALEYIDGASLARCLDGTPWPALQAAALVEALAQGMHYAHSKGVIHRDLKPANIVLQFEDCKLQNGNLQFAMCKLQCAIPKITDFGLAKRLDGTAHTRSEAVLGTPSYMAPEQALAQAGVDARTDVYGLGAILYELLTGRPPFRADAPLQTLQQVVEAEPARPCLLNPAVPRDLETVCLKCLEKEPARRYASAEALADDLRRFENGQPVRARPVGPLGRGWRWCRRNPTLAGLAAVLAVALSAGLSATLYEWRRAVDARRAAVANEEEARQVLSELIQSSPVAPLTGYFPQPPSMEPLIQAAQHCTSLLEKNPDDVDLRIALSNVYGRLGTEYAQRGQMAEEMTYFQQAVNLWESPPPQVAGHPEYRRWLATTRYWRSTVAGDQQEIAQCCQWFLSADAVWEELAEEQPDNLALLEPLTICRSQLRGLAGGVAFAEECRPCLEEQKKLLDRQLQQEPANGCLQKRLAFVYFLLGDAYQQGVAPSLAPACWKQACDHFATWSAAHQLATTEAALVHALWAHACSRLITGSSSDARYAQAVALFEQAGNRLAVLLEQNPESSWYRGAFLESYCSLARCHARVGRATQAEKTYAEHLRSQVEFLKDKRTDPKHVLDVLWLMCQFAHGLRDAELRPAAQALARQAAAITTGYASFPLHHSELSFTIGCHCWDLARILRELGDPAAALQQAEQARQLLEEHCRAVTEGLHRRVQLGQAWAEVGKARWDLGRADEAWAAFQQAAAIQRQVFEWAPTVRHHRVYLSMAYERLAQIGSLRRDWAGAAAALREREKLWLDDAKKLRKVAKDFEELAGAMAQGRKSLSPKGQNEWQKYLSEANRVRQAAQALAARIDAGRGNR